MSGNALTGKCEISPIPDSNHLGVLATTVAGLLNKVFPRFSSNMQRTLVARNKKPHGDLDFVVSQKYLEDNNIDGAQIAGALGSKAWAENGRVLSFEVTGHQVDFIRCPERTLRLNSILYGNGGLGHLTRYLARPFGMKVTDNGLVEVLKDGDQTIGEVLITLDWTEFASILGIDSSAAYYLSYGVNADEDTYRYLTRAGTFTLGGYDINEEFDYVGKPTRLEYPPFQAFVTHVKQQGPNMARAYGGECPWPLAPTTAQKKRIEKVLKPFDTYHNTRKAMIEEYHRSRLLRSKFSGEVAMAATGLGAGKDLGLFMEAYRASFGGRGAFEFHILSSTPETIQESMKSFYSRYQMPLVFPEVTFG